MKVNDKLNLVIPITEGPPVVSAFHTPISREVFEANYRILAATKASLASKGLHYQAVTGPQIAALALKEEGRKEAEAHDADGDAGATQLLEEMKRLTVVLAPGDQGWDKLPVEAAINADVIDKEDWEEVAAQLVFFTCHYWLTKKSDRRGMMDTTASLLDASVTHFTVTDYCDSLRTSTKDADSTRKTSSVPS